MAFQSALSISNPLHPHSNWASMGPVHVVRCVCSPPCSPNICMRLSSASVINKVQKNYPRRNFSLRRSLISVRTD